MGAGLSSTAVIVRDGCYICYRVRLARGYRRRERRRISRVLKLTNSQTGATTGGHEKLTYGWNGTLEITVGPLEMLGSYMGEVGDSFQGLSGVPWYWYWGWGWGWVFSPLFWRPRRTRKNMMIPMMTSAATPPTTPVIPKFQTNPTQNKNNGERGLTADNSPGPTRRATAVVAGSTCGSRSPR